MANPNIMVEPPHGASYVTTAYVPGTVEPNRLAWIEPAPRPATSAGNCHETAELSALPRIFTQREPGVPCSGKPVLGIVYADSPLATHETPAKPLATVSVAVQGLATLVDEAFLTKETCSKFVFANVDNGKLLVSSDWPSGAEAGKHWKIGMLMETGHRGDARILLGIEPPL